MADMAYLRDASWRDFPSTSGVRRQFHLQSPSDAGLTACGVGVINDQDARLVADLPESHRCQRNGCRQLWPTPTPTEESHD